MTVVPDLSSASGDGKRASRAVVAVIAHSGKTLGGGLPELRGELASAGVTDPLWFEVPKSRMAPKRVRSALTRDARGGGGRGGEGEGEGENAQDRRPTGLPMSSA